MNPAIEIIPQVRVLIADDSTVMRTALVRMLESSPIIRVCGTARNGVEAVEKTKLLQPDVVTMDVHMPVLDGIQALKQIMREAPCPVPGRRSEPGQNAAHTNAPAAAKRSRAVPTVSATRRGFRSGIRR